MAAGLSDYFKELRRLVPDRPITKEEAERMRIWLDDLRAAASRAGWNESFVKSLSETRGLERE